MFTVEFPAEDRSLLTLAEIKAAVGETGSSNDTALTALALQVSDTISDLCCVASDGLNPATLMAEDIEETFRLACPQPELPLARRFISSVDSVCVAGTALDDAYYEIDAAAGILRRLDSDGCYINWAAGKTVVSYTAGFSTAPTPLKLAAKAMAMESWSSVGKDPLLRAETHEGLGSFQYYRGSMISPDGVPKAILDSIAPYKHYSA